MHSPFLRPASFPRWRWLTVAATLAGSASGCGSHASTEGTAAAAPAPAGFAILTDEQAKAKLTLEPAAIHDIGAQISATGRVTFDDLRVTHVFSPVTGRITRILAQPGQRVRKGQPLCILQSPDVGSAFSDLAKAEADIIAAEHDYKRKKDLFEQHAGTQSDLEVSEDNFRKSRAEMERARQKARLLSRGKVDRVTQEFALQAPIDGEVIARLANPGIEVQGQYSGGASLELFTIGELDRVWVLADVFEMDLARVKKGSAVTVEVVAYPGKQFHGQVEYIASALDPASRTAKVRCSIVNASRELRPEMYASVGLSTGSSRSLALPRTALLRLGETMNVFVERPRLPDGRRAFERVPVAVADDDGGGDLVPITHGLNAGDVVVVKGGVELLGLL